ncbi:hypothetical protein RCIX2024 [Methanocella arvoryzae MRE50]|uniref:Uncharacterized protein n=2 Tax=Methanocella TaxID=570266 RepID=Q0W369_METAR|nr:hypothetical protein RCIX2024 [Methanocella arvoryzae MRE50]
MSPSILRTFTLQDPAGTYQILNRLHNPDVTFYFNFMIIFRMYVRSILTPVVHLTTIPVQEFFSLIIINIAYYSTVIKSFKNEAVHLMTAIYKDDAIQGNCMSKAEILTQLKTAEEQARGRRAKAEEEARQTIANARKEASAILENARVKAAAEAQSKIDKAAAEISTESKAMRAEGEKSAAALKASAAKNVSAATDSLIKEFERYVDVRASQNG